MPHAIHLRASDGGRWPAAAALCLLLLAIAWAARPPQASAQQEQPARATVDSPAPSDNPQPVSGQAAPSSSGQADPGGQSKVTTIVGRLSADGPPPSKRQRRQAEEAYLSGAKQLEHDDLDAAEREFARALRLDPANANYAIAISVARQHRLTELVRQVSQARLAGDEGKAQTLLAEARELDPGSPLVLEHSEPPLSSTTNALQSAAGQAASSAGAGGTPLADRARMIADAQVNLPWRIQTPDLAGPIHVTPSAGVRSFDLRGVSSEVIGRVTSAYGIRTVIDNSVEEKNLHFNLENVDYQQAMAALAGMANVFLVPIDETSVLVAKDDQGERQRFERQVEETIFVPGSTTEEIGDLTSVMKNVFDVKQVTVQPSSGSIVVRAPEDVMTAMNRTLQGLMDGNGEVVVEVRMYEVDTSKMTTAGANIPTQLGIFNVDQAAAQLVNANQSLVQQAVAQGLISATASNFEIAAALIGSGLVSSSLLSSTIGVFGGGITQTGIMETGAIGINLGLNSSDSRTLDDVQLRVGDRDTATFREGTKYPITTSSYTTGQSGLPSSLSNATINGVSVANLLSQFAGSTSTTIPQITYEDLGVTLNATPTILKSGRVSLVLKLKLEALAGSSVNGIPVLASREFDSSLTVAEGQSALMASHVSSTEASAMSGIPGLSELPGFQLPDNANVQKDTTQLVVVVTPVIVRRRSNLVAGPRMMVPPAPAD